MYPIVISVNLSVDFFFDNSIIRTGFGILNLLDPRTGVGKFGWVFNVVRLKRELDRFWRPTNQNFVFWPLYPF